MTARAVATALVLLLVSAGLVLASTLSVRVGSFYFEDATVGDGRIVAKVGDRLRFYIEDNGNGTPHSVDVDALGIHSGSLAKGDVYTTPQLNQAGTYLLYCRIHLKRGHKTTLVISGTSATPVPTIAPTPAPTPVPTKAAVPTKPPSPTSTPTATKASNPTPSSTPVVVAGATATSTTAPPSGTTASGIESPYLSPGDAAASTDDQEGAIRAGDLSWLRSVVVGVLSLPPLTALAVLAIHRSRRRALASSRQRNPWTYAGESRHETAAAQLEPRRASFIAKER